MADVGRVKIANMALTRLGAQTIRSFDDGSTSADKIKAIYDLVRDAALQDHPWNFAIGRAVLSASSSTPEYEYAYKMTLPSNYLRAVKTEPIDLDYKIEDGCLLTNETSVRLKYIKRVEDESKFSATFIVAFATLLAHKVCYSITGSLSKEQALLAEYVAQLQSARSVDSQEDTPDEIDEYGNTWLDARY